MVEELYKLNRVYYDATHPGGRIPLMNNHTFYYNNKALFYIPPINNLFGKNFTILNSKVENITIISITSDKAELFINPSSLSIDGIITPKHGFTVSTSYIPGVNTSLDRNDVAYCKNWIEKLSYSLFSLYNEKTNRIMDDKYEIVDSLAGYLLPPVNEYNNLYKEIEQSNTKGDDLSFYYYIAKSLDCNTDSFIAAGMFLFYVVVYDLLDKPKTKSILIYIIEFTFCDFIDPIIHFRSIKSTYFLKYVIGATCFIQTANMISHSEILKSSTPNIFSLIIYYEASVGILSMSYILGFIILLPLALIFALIEVIKHTYFTKRVVAGENIVRNDINCSRPYIILFFTIIFSLLFLLIVFPKSIDGVKSIGDILKFIIIFIHLCSLVFQVFCMVIIDYSCSDDSYSLYALFCGFRIILAAEQFPLWILEIEFLQSPPGSYSWTDMRFFLYSIILDIPLTIFYYGLYYYGIHFIPDDVYIPLSDDEDDINVKLTSSQFVDIENDETIKSKEQKKVYDNNSPYLPALNELSDTVTKSKENDKKHRLLFSFDELKEDKEEESIITTDPDTPKSQSKPPTISRNKFVKIITEWIMIISYFFINESNFLV